MKNTLIIIAILMLSFTVGKAQLKQGIPPKDYGIQRDTMDYKYKFFQGDTLYYEMVSKDSIIINFEPALTKLRYEYIKIWCDSVTNNDIMYLSFQLKKFVEKEKALNNDTIVNRKSSWLNRIVSIGIDSTGKRVDYIFDHFGKAGVSPGASFAPHLIMPFGTSRHIQGTTWMNEITYAVPECSIPMPLLKNTLLYRAKKNFDTLGHQCMALEYTKTAVGTFELNNKRDYIDILAKISSAGKIHIDKQYFIPIFLSAEMQQNLTIKQKNGRTMPGWHHLETYIQLTKFVKSPLRK